MYTVVLALNEDENLAREMVDRVAAIPDATDSVRVIVTHVFKDIEAPPSAAVQEPPRREPPEEVVEQEVQPRTVEQVTEMLAERGIEYDVRIERGNPADDIIAIAEETDAEAIYMGGSKRSPAGKVVFGSTTQSVIFSTDRPVTVFGSPD